MHYAFDLSENLKLPVMVRMVTRLSHSRSGVIFKERRTQNGMQLPVDTSRFALIPANAKKQFKKLIQKKTVEKESLPEKATGSIEIKKRFLKTKNVCRVTFRLPKVAAPDAKSVCIV